MKHGVMIGVALLVGLLCGFVVRYSFVSHDTGLWPTPLPEEIACTMDAFECPDGSFVGRSGPDCEFVCPVSESVAPEVTAAIEALADRIVVENPLPNALVSSPLVVTGKARGNWFFEGSFPVVLTNWDGLIIAEGFATAEGEWMTESFVPFTATLSFENPFHTTDQPFMSRSTLILKRDNPSGLPENDAALELPLRFVPVEATQQPQ